MDAESLSNLSVVTCVEMGFESEFLKLSFLSDPSECKQRFLKVNYRYKGGIS